MASRNIPVYLNKDLLETVAVLSEDFPLLHKLFSKHASLVLDMPENDFDSQLADTESDLSHFILGNDIDASCCYGALPEFSLHPEKMAEKGRAMFFLDTDDDTATDLGKKYGVIARSTHIQNDFNPFFGQYKRRLKKEQTIGPSNGWSTLASEYPHSPVNSIVINDNYLFDNDERHKYIGTKNLCSCLKSLMPAQFSGVFQILIVCRYNEDLGHNFYNKLKGNILTQLRNAFDYDIELELVLGWGELLHQRLLLLGYQTIVCDKGFCLFKESLAGNFNVVRDDNELAAYPSFSLETDFYGDSQYYTDSEALQIIAKICKTTLERYEATLRTNSSDTVAVIGYDKNNHCFKNRLINSI